MHIRFIRRALFACVSILLLQSPIAYAIDPLPDNTPEVSPVPTPPAPPGSPASDLTVQRPPSATFTFGDGRQIKTRSRTGRFQLVGLHLNETVDVAVQFPAIPSSSAPAHPLDGGKILSFSLNPVGVGALAMVRFQAGNRPGLYRVLLPGLGGSALLQFWVEDPNNPSPHRPDLPSRNH